MNANGTGERSATHVGATPGWMLIRLGEAVAALPIERVGEVLPPPDVSPVPLAPPWVVGVGSVRGVIVPVIDVAARLGGHPVGSDGRLVLTQPDETGGVVGLLVDGIAGLVERGQDPGATVLDLDLLLDPDAAVSL